MFIKMAEIDLIMSLSCFLTRFVALMIIHGFANALLPLRRCHACISGLTNKNYWNSVSPESSEDKGPCCQINM